MIVTARGPAEVRGAVVGAGALSHEPRSPAELPAWIVVLAVTTGPADEVGYAPTLVRRTGAGTVAGRRLA